MNKILLTVACFMLGFTAFSQDGGQLFTFNFGHKVFMNQSNYAHNSIGIEYDAAAHHIGLALRTNALLRGGDPHLGLGASLKVYFMRDTPKGLYLGAGVDVLLIDGSQIMPRGDLGYNLIFNHFALGFECVVGYDLGYGVSGAGFSSSYFGGLFVGGEVKVGWAF